jgi:2-polyprenyl-3-methyl-5-hydroxy-6-metoxy-1,4-benzoquinol methylase
MEWNIVECVGCRTRLLDPCPADAAIPSLYPPDYEPYQFESMPAVVRRARRRVQRRKVARVRSLASDDATIIDIGCGNGALLELLRDDGEPNWTLIGWDFPGPHLDRLERSGVTVIAAAIDQENAGNLQADVAILNQVVEHFRQPDTLIDLCHRILRPGGHLIIETPNTLGIDARIFRNRHWGGYHIPRHLVVFNSDSIRTLLESNRFSIVRTEHLVSPAFWIQSVHHWLDDRRAGRFIAKFFVVRNPLLLAVATALDFVTARFAPTSNQRVVARKSHSDHGVVDSTTAIPYLEAPPAIERVPG